MVIPIWVLLGYIGHTIMVILGYIGLPVVVLPKKAELSKYSMAYFAVRLYDSSVPDKQSHTINLNNFDTIQHR